MHFNEIFKTQPKKTKHTAPTVGEIHIRFKRMEQTRHSLIHEYNDGEFNQVWSRSSCTVPEQSLRMTDSLKSKLDCFGKKKFFTWLEYY
jgi:uncharacterized protein with HEPN domain